MWRVPTVIQCNRTTGYQTLKKLLAPRSHITSKLWKQCSSLHLPLEQNVWQQVAISFSNAWKWKVKGKSISRVRLLATPWTAAYQAPPSMGFSRQEYWSGVPLPSPSWVAGDCYFLCEDFGIIWYIFKTIHIIN